MFVKKQPIQSIRLISRFLYLILSDSVTNQKNVNSFIKSLATHVLGRSLRSILPCHYLLRSDGRSRRVDDLSPILSCVQVF